MVQNNSYNRSQAPPIAASSGKTLFTVQALRALAAVMVVIHHLLTVISEDSSTGRGHQWMGGSTGVDIFFVISGLVMMTSSRSLPHEHTARRFLLLRLERIVPPYWLLTTLKVILLLALPAISSKGLGTRWHIIASYLFVPALSEGSNYPVLVAGWTLSFEIVFYLLFALALALRANLIRFLTCAILLVVISSFFIHPSNFAALTILDPIILEFLYGIVLGHVLMCKRLPAPSVSIVLLLFGYASLLWFAPDQAFWIRPIACGLPALAVVSGAVGLEKLIGTRIPEWISALGNSSYSLYLTHGLLVPIFVALFRKIKPEGIFVNLIFVICGTFICIGVGELFYRWVERPMMMFFRRQHRPSEAYRMTV